MRSHLACAVKCKFVPRLLSLIVGFQLSVESNQEITFIGFGIGLGLAE